MLKQFHLSFLVIVLTAFFLQSCSTAIQTAYTGYNPLPLNTYVTIYGANDIVPSNYKPIGQFRIGDSGFTTNCGYTKVMEDAKSACRRMGGDAFQITSLKEPDPSGLGSTCYRIRATAYRSPEKVFAKETEGKTGWTMAKLKAEWNDKGVDYIEGIYEKIGDGISAKYTIALKKVNSTEYKAIYISGAYNHNKTWVEGDLKAKVLKTGADNIYKTSWLMSDKSINSDFYMSFDKGTLSLHNPETGLKDLYLKLYPTSESVLGSISPSIIGSGTGFAINSEGYIVTNYHVIKENSEISIKGINGDFNQSYTANVVLKDVKNDLALLLVELPANIKLDSVRYGIDFDPADVGLDVYALGYPLRATMGDEIKLTNGIISSKTGFQGDATTYQVSVPVQPGNSGGPLFNKQGNVVGIISAKHIGAENASYAVKTSYLENLLDLSNNKIQINAVNPPMDLSLSEQVKIIKSSVYIIECR
ncbi:MAG: serine protease [Cytophagales bacterium]